MAAYGDLGLNVKVIEKFTQDVLKQHGEAAAALVKLGSLPADVRNLSSTSDNLTVAVSVLNKKTDEMALLDIKSTRKDLDLVADRFLSRIENSLRELTSFNYKAIEKSLGDLIGMVQASRSEISRDVLEKIGGQFTLVILSTSNVLRAR